MAVLTISSIELSNFMCHKHFLLSFKKKITCIAGRNGTGKSAIMIALGVVFGQRVNALERGNSFANLIRTGCNQAIIRVVLNNHMKILVDKYGTEITIEKRLRAGTSKLTVLKDGRPTAMAVTELQSLLNAYGLKFDNPLNFLTQEKSKKFLMTAGPEELYEYYYKGSEFKTINEEISQSLSILNEMNSKLKGTAEEYERVNVELTEQQENLKFLSMDYKAMLKKLEIEEMIIGLKGMIEDINRNEKENEERMDKENELKMRHKMEQAELKEMKVVMESTASVDSEIEKVRLKIRSMENDSNEYIKEREEAESAIRSIRMRCRLEETREELADVSKELAKVDEDILRMESRDAELALKAGEEKEQNKELDQKRYVLSKQISFLKSNQHDEGTKQLLDRYDKVKVEMERTKFEDEVFGPVCDYIKLKDKKWYKPVSIVLKRSLSSFIVFNKNDRQSLNEIFKRVNVNFPVSLFSSKKVISNLKTVENSLLGVLELDKGIVLNQLVMFHNVEQIMLVERREDAYKIIKNGSIDRNGNAIESAYTLDGDKIKLTNGSLSDYKVRDMGRCWFEDTSTKIKYLEQALKAIKMGSVAQEELHRNGKELGLALAHKRDLEGTKKELEAKIGSIAGLSENNTEIYDRKVASLNRNIELLKIKIDEYKTKLKEETNKKSIILDKNFKLENEFKRKQDEQSRQVDRMMVDIAELEASRNGGVAEIRRLRDMADTRFKAILAYCEEEGLSKQNEMKDSKNIENNDDFLYPKEGNSRFSCESKRDSTKSVGFGSCTLPAWEDCQDVDFYKRYFSFLPLEIRQGLKFERSIDEVAKEKKRIKGLIIQARRMGSKEDIKKEIRMLADEKELCRRIRERYERSTNEIAEACSKRLKKRDEIKDRKTVEASKLFEEFTRRGGYEGCLAFNHDEMRLEVKMKVHQAEVAGSKSTLSGGERSFAGICFLLSLWRSFCCPVKVLDEFDVFMDVINRKVAIQTLFGFFKESDMQVILITPLSTEELVDSECEIRVLTKEE